MGGGPVHMINECAWGVDLVEEALLAATGVPSRPPLPRMPRMMVAENSVNARETGILANDDFLQARNSKMLPDIRIGHLGMLSGKRGWHFAKV